MLRGIILGAVAGLCCMDMAFASPRVDFVYRPSSGRILYESRVFLPIVSSHDSILFGDIRGVSNFDTSTEFNLGIGRGYTQKIDAVIGAYYFYDRRQQSDLFEQGTMGAEYDYNDASEKRGASFTFRVGLPFGKKEQNYRSDYRMIKPIVRDVDVRIDKKVVSEDAQAKIILPNGSKMAFDEMTIASTEAEFI